jgi:hypothetical protein
MKRAANEFSEEVLWAQIREGVERYEEQRGGEKGVARRKRKLKAKHSINGHDYLSKVVYIHPTDGVTGLSSGPFLSAIKKLLKENGVIAEGDSKKFRCKWFNNTWRKEYIIDDLRLEFDTEGDNAHPYGTVAVYGEAAIDLVNYVNKHQQDKSKKAKHKDGSEDNVTDEPKKGSKHKTSDEPKKVVVTKKKASDEPKKVAVTKKKASDEPKKVAVTKKKASDEPKKVAVTKKKASDEPKKVAVTKKKTSDEPKKVVRASEIKALSLKDKPKRPSQKQNKETTPVQEKDNKGGDLNDLEKHLIPFLKSYYWSSKHPKMPSGELVVPTYKPYNSKDEVHELPYTIYVTPPQGPNADPGLSFGTKLMAHVTELLHSMKISKFTMKLKTTPDTNYEVEHANIGVYRAELNDPKYPIGTLMLSSGTLARLVNHYRPKFGLELDVARSKRKESHPRKSYSEDSGELSNVVVPPVMNFIQRPEPSVVVESQQALVKEIALRFLEGNDNSMNAAQVKSSENQQLKEEQELKQAPIANNDVIILDDIDLAIISEDDDPELAEIRNLVRDNSSLATEMHRKSQEFESLEKQVVKTKELYESEKNALKAEVKAKLPILRQQQAALTAQVQSLGKRIEERAQTQTIWEDKLKSIKKVKLEKSPEAQVTNPTQKLDSVLEGDSIKRRDSATALCQMVGQGEDSSKFSLDDLGVVSPTTGSMFSDWNRTAVLRRVGTASNLGSDEDKNSNPLSLSNLTPVVSKVRERSPEKDPAHESEGKRPKL